MEEEKEKARNPFHILLESGEEYGRSTLELIKLKAVDKGSRAVSTAVLTTILVVIVSVFFLMATIGAALWIGEILGKAYPGFLIVAAFYLLAGLTVFFVFRKWIKKKIIDLIIKNTLKQE